MQEITLKNIAKDYRSNEAYKTLRTNIEFSGADNKVIVLTSCTPNEGKSTVSLGLSMSLAESGKKVLFIDADLRKSVLVGRHRVTEEVKGLSHFLSGQAEVEEVMYKTLLLMRLLLEASLTAPSLQECVMLLCWSSRHIRSVINLQGQ